MYKIYMKSYRNKSRNSKSRNSKSRNSKSRKITRQTGSNDIPPNFHGAYARYYYGMNDFRNSTMNPSSIVNSRLYTGKKSRKNRRMRQRGGFLGFSSYPFLGNSSMNIPASFGSVPFAFNGTNVLSGNVTAQYPQNPNTVEHPTDEKYNYNNPPLA
jgi:hypothetical protein